MPLSFDQYKGCGFRCIYCFAYYQRYQDAMCRNDYQKGIIKEVRPDKIIDLLEGKGTSQKHKLFYEKFIKEKKVIQWGALGDPFCPIEKSRKVGYPIIEKLVEMKYPVSFSTKGTWFVDDKDYFNLFKQSPETMHVKFSIITSDEKKAARIEKGVPTPKERFKAMKKLSDIGVATTLRLRPYIIGLTDIDIEETIKSAAEAGAISVSTEFFCLDIRAGFSLKQRYKELSKILGFDIQEFYKKNSHHMGYLRMDRGIKKPYIEQLQELCKKYKLKLYVSDPDFKEISCHGSCCGLPQTKEFGNYMKAQLCELLCYMRDNKKKEITWSEYVELFKEDFEWQKHIGYGDPHNLGSGHGYHMKKNMTLYNYNKNCWNNPKSNTGPFKYFGGTLTPKGLDKKGDMIYTYTR